MLKSSSPWRRQYTRAKSCVEYYQLLIHVIVDKAQIYDMGLLCAKYD